MAQLPSQSQFGDYGEWPGRDVLDSDGERLGGVREIYLDRETGRPEWVLVAVEGHDDRFVPLADAAVEASTIRVAHSADEIRRAPGIGSEARIDQSEERRLYEHYGLGYAEAGSGLPEDVEPASEDDVAPVVIPPWRESDEPATWSEVAAEEEPVVELAPLPAEPPSPAEIEAADIPEPPAAREVEAEPEAEAAVEAEPEAAVEAEPAVEPEPDVVAPSAAGEILAAGAAAPEALAPEPDGPVLVPDPGAPAPGTPPRPDFAPPFAPPPPSGGTIETVKSRRGGIAAGVALAAVLFFIIRRLR